MRKITTKLLPITELIEEYDLYPRAETMVDDRNVSDLAEALRSMQATGEKAQFDPIVAARVTGDKMSYPIIDGWHRRRAYLRVLGDSVRVPVTLFEYESKAEMLLHATKLNSTHGLKLKAVDQKRVVLMLRKLDVPEKTIAVTLGVTDQKVRRMALDTARVVVPGSRLMALPEPEIVPLKRSLAQKFRGGTMTPRQREGQRSAPGVSYSQVCDQLLHAFEMDYLDLTDERLCWRLRRLAELVQERVPPGRSAPSDLAAA